MKYDPRYKEVVNKRIKLMCDCAMDIKEKYKKKASLLVAARSFVNDHKDIKDNSDNTTRPLRVAWCGESHDTVIPMLHIQDEVNDLKKNGMDIDGKHYTFTFNYCADYKNVLLAYGKGGSGSSHPCIWCNGERKTLNHGPYKHNDLRRVGPEDERKDSLTPEIHAIMPTYFFLMKQIATKREANVKKVKKKPNMYIEILNGSQH
jgi:hypothetical protein